MNKPHYVSAISAGHILTAASMVGSSLVIIVAVTLAWGNLRGDVDDNTRRITLAEERIEAVPERLARIEAILERIERAQSGAGWVPRPER